MHKIYYTLLFAACFCISIDCQGGGGGSSSGGGGGGGHRHDYRYGSSDTSRSTGTSCNSAGCQIFIYSLIGVIGICIGIGFSIFLCYRSCQGRPSNDNQTFVTSNSERQIQEVHQTNRNEHMESLMNRNHCNAFRSGIWESRYYQYREWHGPYESLLSFDPQTMQVAGSGWDNVGKFTVFGYYSNETRRMGLTKTYQRGTGDSKENLGHKVVIQVTENLMKVFEGKWYVQTSEFHGEDLFEMKFIRERDFETPTESCSTTAKNAEIHLDKSSRVFLECEKQNYKPKLNIDLFLSM